MINGRMNNASSIIYATLQISEDDSEKIKEDSESD